jgi:hypothetical protein
MLPAVVTRRAVQGIRSMAREDTRTLAQAGSGDVVHTTISPHANVPFLEGDAENFDGSRSGAGLE